MEILSRTLTYVIIDSDLDQYKFIPDLSVCYQHRLLKLIHKSVEIIEEWLGVIVKKKGW